MLAVKGMETDYAIMKQVQQLKLAYPKTLIVDLNKDTNFSRIEKNETLYLLGHGDATSGDFRSLKTEDIEAYSEFLL